jgi:hypothetical protein
MAKDARLELGRYISNPFNKQGKIVKQLDFNDLFRAKPDSGEYPWNPSRFTEEDLLKRSMTRKRVENPGLNFASNAPFFDGNEGVTREYEVFDGIGRFNRTEDYSFEDGRPVTKQRPQDQPDFDPGWVEAYRLSPTLKPGDVAKNPMPRTRNPDPNGFLMANAEARVEAEVEDTQSIASLLEREGSVSEETVKKEEAEGEQTVEEEQEVG